MKNKSFYNVFIIVLLLIAFTSISSVASSWVYYEGPVDSASATISVQLKKFFYLQNDFEEEFPTTPSGNDNANAFEQIMGQITESQDTSLGHGLNNPTSDLNLKSLTSRNLPSSNFITSIDIVGADVNLIKKKPNSSGLDTRANLDIGPEISFLIQKDVENSGDFGGDQFWYTYTTDTPLYSNTTKIIDGKEVVQVNDHINGENLLQADDIIKDVYRTQLKWIPDWQFSDKGHYEIIKSERGYAKASLVPQNNNKGKLFINPAEWKPGIYNGLIVRDETNPNNDKYDLGVAFQVKVIDNNQTDSNSYIYQSSNNEVANINEEGYVTITNNSALVKNNSITIAAYDKNDLDRYGALIIKLNVQPSQ